MSILLTAGKHWRIPWVVACILVSFAAGAQQKVSGKVFEKKTSAPMSGVTIKEKGVSNSLSTKEDGSFTIVLKTEKPVLEITFIGYTKQEIAVNGRTTLEISMEEDSKGMEDVVVIGYQNVQRRKTTAAISTVKGKDIENTPYATFDQMLQGRVAGLNVLSISGEPGANNIVNIRGSSSISNEGNGISTPLYVIDGVVFDVSDSRTSYGNNPLTAINPNDIESIDVLKDASAAAIYGARAANGVIIVKTKRPKTGSRPQIRLSSYVGISTRPAMKPVLTGTAERRQKMDLINKMASYEQRANMSQWLTDSLNPAFNNNTDFQGLFLQDAIINNVDLNLAAAEERFAYRLSLNRYYEEGVMIGYNLQRMSPRLYLSVKPYKGIEVATDLYMEFTKSKHGSGTGDRYPFTAWGFPSSFWRVTEQDMKNYQGRNDEVRDDDRTFSINGNTRLIANITPEILFTSSLSYNVGNVRRDYLRPGTVNPFAPGRSDAIHFASNSRRWELENYLTWTKEIKDHTITTLIGQGMEELTISGTNAEALDIPLSAIKMIQGISPGAGLSVSTSFEERARLSLFARIGYDYKGKYGIDGSFRRDASSRYGKNDRWGTFPAISGRWIVSDEPFFKPFKNIISFFKIRGSYGVTGRDPGSFYAQYRTLAIDGAYPGSSLGAGSSGRMTTYNGTTAVYPNYSASAPARNITWERSPQSNIGIDASFLNDRINITLDYYVKDSKELVFDVPVALTTGYTTATNNYVDVRNTGIELSLTTNNLSRNSAFKWTTTLNIAFNDNYVLKLPQGNRDFIYGPPWMQRKLTIGRPLFGFSVWDVQGVYANNKDVPVDPLTGDRIRWGSATGNFFGAGDPIRRDLNGDYIIDDLDKVEMGSPQTKMQGGIINSFSWKGLSVQVLCTFISGRKLWNGYLSDKLQDAGSGDNYSYRWGPYSGPSSDFGGLNFWQQPGDIAEYPSLFGNNVDKWHIGQSLFVEDASFFRVKNVSIGYALPQQLFKGLKVIKGIRVYSILDNLLVVSNATVPDPEAVQPDGYSSGNDYPIPKKFTFGIEVNF